MAPRKSAKAMKVETIRTDHIIPYANNAKIHPEVQVGQIVASIQQFGFVQPILIDADNVVVAGHGRLLAAVKLQMPDVPVIRVGHLTPAQVQALRIADNSIAQSGTTWDVDLLEAELAALRAVKFDLESLGLENIELPDLDEDPVPVKKANRSKTTIFLSVPNAQADKASKLCAAALDKAKIPHNL